MSDDERRFESEPLQGVHRHIGMFCITQHGELAGDRILMRSNAVPFGEEWQHDAAVMVTDHHQLFRQLP